jgi:hypothetical protein
MQRAVVVASRDSTIKVAARIVATFVRVAMDTQGTGGGVGFDRRHHSRGPSSVRHG